MLIEIGLIEDVEIFGYGVSDEIIENLYCSEYNGILLGNLGYICKWFLMMLNLNLYINVY